VRSLYSESTRDSFMYWKFKTPTKTTGFVTFEENGSSPIDDVSTWCCGKCERLDRSRENVGFHIWLRHRHQIGGPR